MTVFDFSGQRIMVTGANTGIGQAIALAFAASGAEVIGVGRSSMDDTISRAAGTICEHICDLGERQATEGLVEAVETKFGPINALVNNAGIIHRAAAVDVSLDDWDDVININLRAVFALSTALARSAIRSGRTARIVNIASLLSYQGGVRVPSYTASKSAVIGLTRALCNEWSARGINVNAVAPGYIKTNNTQALQDDPERSRQILDRIPAGRWGNPGDISGAVLFLCSDLAHYIHGVTLPVDGGWLAR